jgi:hypothetical protein
LYHSERCITWTQFSDSEEVKDMVYTWLHVQPKTFFADGIRKLMDQNNNCVETQVDFFEKCQYEGVSKVFRLATWSENCKWYSSLPLGAVVSLFYESV